MVMRNNIFITLRGAPRLRESSSSRFFIKKEKGGARRATQWWMKGEEFCLNNHEARKGEEDESFL